MLQEALAIDRESPYNNFFYGMVRVGLGETEVGITHLEKARQALVTKLVLSTEERSLLQGVESFLAEHRP